MPTLPANMVRMMTAFPTPVRDGVRPSERPTVPNAENASKATVRNRFSIDGRTSSSLTVSTKMASARMAKARSAYIIPRAIESADTLRPKACTSSRAPVPRRIMASTMKNVVVLMPPPVEAGEAPMYIRNIVKNFEGSVSVAWFTVSNPAVRGVTDWNRAAITRCSGPRSR